MRWLRLVVSPGKSLTKEVTRGVRPNDEPLPPHQHSHHHLLSPSGQKHGMDPAVRGCTGQGEWGLGGKGMCT